MKVDNAIIMAAGTASRFAPLSYEKHKALIEVKGEILIEREIRQLQEAGINEIYIITGYKAEQFNYLVSKFGVKLIHNPEYLTRNNNGSIWAARNVIRNTYICSSDNYFTENPFENEVDGAYYSAVYAKGATNEWCLTEKDGVIDSVQIGGKNCWYMLGHVFWDEQFSQKFLSILSSEYNKEETKNKLWEAIYIDHISDLPLKIRKYRDGIINEFDTLDELRVFDSSYIKNTHSMILRKISEQLNVNEENLVKVNTLKGKDASAIGFTFECNYKQYRYYYESQKIEEINEK